MTIRKLTEKAKSGDTEAQYELALSYFLGKNIDKNETTACMWFRQSANGGNFKAFSWLAYFYKNGIVVKQDYSIALQWLMKYVETDDSKGQICAEIADFYFNGWGVKKDYGKAVEWCLKAVSYGVDVTRKIFSIQCYILLEEVKSGTLQEADIDEKIKLNREKNAILRSSMQKPYTPPSDWPYEDCFADTRGIEYEDGGSEERELKDLYYGIAALHEEYAKYADDDSVIIKELETALSWYNRPEETDPRWKKGLYLYSKIAVKYEEQCAGLYGIPYNKESYMSYDPFMLEHHGFIDQYDKFDKKGKQLLEKAFDWYSRGAEAGNYVCATVLTACYTKGIIVKFDDAKAYYWLQKSISNKYERILLESVIYKLAECFYNGDNNLAKNYARAVFWFCRYKENNFPSDYRRLQYADYYLGKIYEEGGYGVERDIFSAVRYYKASGSDDARQQLERLLTDNSIKFEE